MRKLKQQRSSVEGAGIFFYEVRRQIKQLWCIKVNCPKAEIRWQKAVWSIPDSEKTSWTTEATSCGRVIDTDITWKWDVGPNTWYKIWIFPQCWVKAVKGTKHSVLWSAQFPWEHSGEFTQNIYTTFSFQQNTDRSPLTLCFQPFSFRWSVTFTFNSTFLLYLFCYRMHFCGKLSRTSASADAF